MADNFLENHYEDYLRKKAEWQRKKKHLPKISRHNNIQKIERPDDEAL